MTEGTEGGEEAFGHDILVEVGGFVERQDGLATDGE